MVQQRWSFESSATIVVLLVLVSTPQGSGWMPDFQSKMELRFEDVRSNVFYGNRTYIDYFKLLEANEDYVLVGARNILYNLTVDDLDENVDHRLEWPSSVAHQELCLVKGKEEHECQNYLRVLAKTDDDRLLICGSNSYKPLCREYTFNDGKYIPGPDSEGIGQCPYSPEHNSTALYYKGHLYTATRSFAGEDSLIYRKPQRTERSDLKQLNAPNFVSSFGHGDYVFFFYRETAVEYINCGKTIYSRVARVCKDDKGGPHQFHDLWTSFLKARLNCSIPGEYPFYFDEIQATSDVINGTYGDRDEELIYGVMTTPTNAIGGSAICAYNMKDILNAFEGHFKAQADINTNWLPVESDRVPSPRPGKCVKDSRTLPFMVVNFVKSHPLMEQSVPTYFGKPILVHVSLQYRFTTIAVDKQAEGIDGKTYDILYIGTDDGKLLKVVYSINKKKETQATVISKSQVLPAGVAITGLKVVSAKNKIIVISKTEIRTIDLNSCSNKISCSSCVKLQDPHCVWDLKKEQCVRTGSTFSNNEIQSIDRGDDSKCPSLAQESEVVYNEVILSGVGQPDVKKADGQLTFDVLDNNNIPMEVPLSTQEANVIYTAETLVILLTAVCLIALVIGFLIGYLFSRRFHPIPTLVEAAVLEQHNHLNRFSNANLNTSNRSSFLPPRANKTINIACNLPASKVLMKKDNNLDASKELNNSIESIDKNTLQKVKKTYI